MKSTTAFESIKSLKKKLTAKEISKQELLSFYIDRFKRYDNDLGSALELFDVDSILKMSRCGGLLEGIPGLIKDNISQQGRRLTCASKMLGDFVSTYDATVCKRLKQEGAFLIGRANMDEFAMGSSNETSAFFPVKNPWDTSRVPGGSSGGSIAAVAAGLVPWSLGSDTGGSVRQPAAFCGVVGMKPTYGLVSRYGLVAYGSSLDQVGVATRTVYDNALVLSAIAGHDLKDSSSLYVARKDYTQKLDGTLPENCVIGVIENALDADAMEPEVKVLVENALEVYKKRGATIKRICLPSLNYSAAAYFILSRAEAASNLARFDGVRYGFRNTDVKTLAEMYADTRHDGFGSEVKSRIMVGNYVLSSGHAGEFYENAQRVQRWIRRDFSDAFRNVTALVMPASPGPAFKLGAYSVDTLKMDLQDYFTCPMNLAGVPAISVPCGFTKENLPIGFQLIGPHLSEGVLYQIAHAYEEETQWHAKYPEKYLD